MLYWCIDAMFLFCKKRHGWKHHHGHCGSFGLPGLHSTVLLRGRLSPAVFGQTRSQAENFEKNWVWNGLLLLKGEDPWQFAWKYWGLSCVVSYKGFGPGTSKYWSNCRWIVTNECWIAGLTAVLNRCRHGPMLLGEKMWKVFHHVIRCLKHDLILSICSNMYISSRFIL